MKNALKTSALIILGLFMANCSGDDNGGGGGNVANGWKVGGTTYSTQFTQRFATGNVENAINALDLSGGETDLNALIVIFNEEAGIAAGTYKIISELNGAMPAADEIFVNAGTNYTEATGQYGTNYYPTEGQSVNATVTITGGKVKIVIPQINVAPFPANSGSPTTLMGTLVEM